MQEIFELLNEIVQRTMFDVRIKRRRETSLSYNDNDGRPQIGTVIDWETLGKLSSIELQDIYNNNKWRSGEWGEKLLILPDYSDEKVTELNAKLRSTLDEYVETEDGHIGHGLSDLIDGPQYETMHPNGFISTESVSSICDFCNYLIIGAAILGPKRIARYLCEWMAGNPLYYQIIVLIVGVTIDQPLALQAGIRITNLPMSSNEFPNSLPDFGSAASPAAYLGGVILSIDCEAVPVLYKPQRRQDEGWRLEEVIQHTWSLKKSSLDKFCESLSLACNGCIRYKQFWRDYGELNAFSDPSSKGGMPMKLISDKGIEIPLSQEHLELAWDIHRRRNSTNEKQGLSTAISRWVNSKRPESDLADQFIDLRIALEALYLKRNHKGGMSFRLAVHGALHLSADINERRKYYKNFSDAYSRASKAVHEGILKNTPENRKLLATAQDLCRDGILKKLKGEEEPNWDDMILGSSK